MLKRWLALGAALAILLGGGAAAARLFAPRLVRVTPAPGASQVPASADLRLEFSRVMALASVQEHLRIQPAQAGSFAWEGTTLIFTPDAPWPRGSVIQVELRSGARAARFPSLPLLETTAWQFQVSRPRLAYLWPSEGPADLYALDPLSGEIQRLTAGENVLDYSVSQDGRWVYFSADDGQGGSRVARIDLFQIVVGPEQPPQPEPLLECPQASCRLAQPSPDGRWVVYERAALQTIGAPERSAIWLYSLAQRQSQRVSDPEHLAANPAWSPGGLLSFFDRDLEAYQVFHPEQGVRFSLPNQTGEPGSWQPDGEAFVALEVLIESTGLLDPHGISHLIRYDLGQAEIAQVDLSRAYDLEDNDPAFSPDGTRLAFSRRYLDPGRWTPGRQLWVMQADGSQARPLTAEPAFHHYAFAWSPDGLQIAYIRFDPTLLTHPPELWLINAAGDHPIQLVIGGFAPAWIP